MSSNPPPTNVVPIYNPAYFASSTEGLTIGEASGIFLNKTSPDIATALETFNAGINTNNITPTTTASTLSLNSSKTGSTNADPAIAIATSSGITRTIKIGREGGTNPNSVHLAGLDVTNTGLNNITATTGVINIGNLQTDGILNLGTGTRTATGVINIGNVLSENRINIETASTLNTNADPAISIGTGTGDRFIKLGNPTTTVLCSDIGIKGNAINHRNTGDNVNIGNLQIAGTLNLGTNGARTGAINMGSATTTGAISIETANTNNTPASSGAIQIGTTSVNKTIRIGHPSTTGTVTLGNFQVATISGSSTTFLNTITAGTQAISIGNSQTSAPLGLGTGGGLPASRIAGGDVNIANQASNACNINVMNGNTTAGNVNIANGTGATQTTSVNIGSGSTTGQVTIGNSANTVALQGAVTSSGLITANGGLTMGGANNITLGNGTVSPATSANLGFSVVATGSVSCSVGIATNICNTGSLVAGVWLVMVTFDFPNIVGRCFGWLNTVSATFLGNKGLIAVFANTTGGTSYTTSYVFKSTSAQTYYAISQLETTAGTVAGTIEAVRLA